MQAAPRACAAHRSSFHPAGPARCLQGLIYRRDKTAKKKPALFNAALMTGVAAVGLFKGGLERRLKK